MSKPRAIRAKMSGHVQGVGFRWWAASYAIEIGAKGWILNMDNGEVLAHVEGDPETVAKMLHWLNRGPKGSRVDNVDIVDVKPIQAKKFLVRY